MEQQPTNTEGRNNPPSGEGRPTNGSDRTSGQGRNRNRHRNRNRGRNRGRDGGNDGGSDPSIDKEGQPTDELVNDLSDDELADLAIDGVDTSFIGVDDDDSSASAADRPRPERTNRPERNGARQDGRQDRNNARNERNDSRGEGRNDGRGERNNDRNRDGQRQRDGQERTPSGGSQSGSSQSGGSQSGGSRPERTEGRPDRNNARPERPERVQRERDTQPERPLLERQERVVEAFQPPIPERQERYEPMAVERFGGASVFETDDDQPGRGERPPVSDAAKQERLIVGITLGDYNGIGPEVILKALQYNQLQKICTPVIYGSMRVLNRYRNLLNLKDWNLNGIQQVEQASHKMTNVITCFSENTPPPAPPAPVAEPTEGVSESDADATQAVAEAETPPVAPPAPAPVPVDIQPGKVTPEAGRAAFACLSRAVEDLRAGKIHALVTAPINKHNIQSEAFAFPGHTEYLASAFGIADNLMFMVSETLRVGVVTGHVPLGKVRQGIHKGAILQKLDMMTKSLKQDFGIRRPKIAVLGLNPHAGENGLLGNEEREIITPLINELRNKGQLVYGPFPADGFFGTRAYRKYDAVLAMYHDQGLIPFKSIAFDEGVNFTAGMPAVRTSPDHGTAYDIAGKGLADETSIIQAIYTACDVARRRFDYQELEANALKK